MSFHFPWVFPLISDRWVWHSGKHPYNPVQVQSFQYSVTYRNVVLPVLRMRLLFALGHYFIIIYPAFDLNYFESVVELNSFSLLSVLI